MATIHRKRRTSGSLEAATKKLRLEKPIASPEDSPSPADEDDDDEGDAFTLDAVDSSEDEPAADTPATPLSPAPRKKFPSEYKTHKCTYDGCDKSFNRPARLVAHLRSHTNERPFKCPYDDCDKSYLEDKHLQQHIKGSHTKERSFQCSWEGCGKSFLTATRLRRHEETHKGHERFRCTAYPPCDQTFRKHQTLQRHIRSEHLQLAPFPCLYIDPITLVPCNAGFDGAVGLRKHQERLHGTAKFFCRECIVPGSFNANGTPVNLGFTSEKQLQLHIRKEHPVCAFCDLKCSSQGVLTKHIETQHSGTTVEQRKTIPCTVPGCEKKFTTQYNLKTHILTIHEGSRYICGTFDLSNFPDVARFSNTDGCGKDFVSKQVLRDHIRVAHLGLISIGNGNRKKASDSDIDMVSDIDTDDGEDYVPPPKKRRNERAKGAEPDILDVLTGKAYAEDPKRKLPCQVPGCQYRFMRQYDLENHLRIAHHDLADDDDPDYTNFDNQFQYPAPEPVMTGIENQLPAQMDGGMGYVDQGFDHGNLHWELQHNAMEGGPFWIGADQENEQIRDPWTQDSMEMRALIDRSG